LAVLKSWRALISIIYKIYRDGAADTLAGACPAETALTPVGRMDAMRKRLAAVRAAAAAIRPALTHFYEALDQGQKVRFAGMS
jgi:hypothetical protein